MINIIKDNTKEEFYTICSTCGSELSYSYEDVKMKENPYNYMPDRSIVCPVCGKETYAELKSKNSYSYNTSGQFRLPFLNNAIFNGSKEQGE